jgi:hypothetical protein
MSDLPGRAARDDRRLAEKRAAHRTFLRQSPIMARPSVITVTDPTRPTTG